MYRPISLIKPLSSKQPWHVKGCILEEEKEGGREKGRPGEFGGRALIALSGQNIDSIIVWRPLLVPNPIRGSQTIDGDGKSSARVFSHHFTSFYFLTAVIIFFSSI
ncbi:hypothetical protein CDAR_26191 [Caerostris darwini]|uniref:Uncharacterized protein n=1 Tax=Caerostris darwini TaxID=1538125 RepID=A0AAV4N894_9ARAC|nr:hypothetical protein CDAR_26191 [Caerostris darwini]